VNRLPAVLLFAGGALAGAGALAVVIAPYTQPQSPAAPPAAEQGDPNGRVVQFQVNGRTLSCVVVDPPGDALAVWCDGTREAS
jgi:hypothetical protein